MSKRKPQAKFYETTSFKKTQATWYKKLKDSGFKDIDAEDSPTIRNQEFTIDNSKLTYFQKCRAYLTQTKLELVDQVIFEMHCNGETDTSISEHLTSQGPKALTREAVHYRIRNILSAAKIQPIRFNV